MISLTISQRVDGKWQPYDLFRLCRDGQAFLDGLKAMDGHEFVGEWCNGEIRAMACGLEKQAALYRDKGVRTITFQNLADGLQSKGFHLDLMKVVAHETVRKYQEALGGTITKAEAQENREHRVAYMTQDGDVTDEQAHGHCDTMPSEYGHKGE